MTFANLKFIVRRSRCLALILLVLLGAAACERRSSAVAGKVVDWEGRPVAGVKITAHPVAVRKGDRPREAVTNAGGVFRFERLSPDTQYELRPWSDKWTTAVTLLITTPPQGQSVALPAPMLIAEAFSKKNGGVVYNLATGTTRFTVSAEGVIADAKTGLQWLPGPDRDVNYEDAVGWVADSETAGGGWRMPTREELNTLFLPAEGLRNLDASFTVTAWCVWAEPKNSITSYFFHFRYGKGLFAYLTLSEGYRVFGVR